MDKIIINNNGIGITIEGESEHFFGQDLYTKAVVTLIEGADTHGWEKHNFEHGTNEDALGEFCAAVLTAVTRLYASEAGLPEDEEIELPPLGTVGIPQRKPVHQILSQMIEHLRESDYLNEVISGGSIVEEPEDLN
ncbi:MAG TPA: hypothetical protein VF543_03215 [Pyrinomonadaceae bacterium]|jgi:hypothetical protein